MRPSLLSLALPLLLAPLGVWTCCSCGWQSNRRPAGSAAAASTSAALHVPQGPYPRGQAGPGSAPGPQGPVTEVLSPAPGSQLAGPNADVALRLADADGVRGVTVQGLAATDQGAGRWTVTIPLSPGLNVIAVEAEDGLGTRSRSAFTLLQGAFLPPGAEVPAACQARLGQAALDLIGARIEAAAGGLDLLALIHQAAGRPAVNTSLVKVDVTSVAHAPPRLVELRPAPAGLTAALELDALSVELEVDLIGRGLVWLEASRVRLDLEAAFSPAAGGASGARLLGLDLARLDLSFQGLTLRARSAAADLVLTPFKGLILTALQGALERALRGAAPGLLARPLPGVDTPLLVQVPVLEGGTRPLELRGRLTGGRGWPGVALDLQAALSLAAAQPHHAGTSLGILVGAPPPGPRTPSGPDEVEVALSQDAANALAHAYWHAGGARYRVDGTRPSSGAVPLSARLLHPFFPLARDLAPDPDTPLLLDASLEAPPVVRLAAGGAVTLLVPEAQVAVWFDYMDGGPPLELLRARLALEVSVQVDVVGGELVFGALSAAQQGVNVTAEPAGDLDDQGVEDFLHQALPIVLGAVQLPRVPIPALPAGVPLLAPGLEVQDGWLVVRGKAR